MSRRRKGMTLTELLTVVSVIAILTSMMSPILLRAHKEAIRRSCMGNIKEIATALELIANDNVGKLPTCIGLDSNGRIDESQWWYRKVARVLYPHNDQFDQLSVPRSDYRYSGSNKSTFWADNPHTNLIPFDPNRCVLRCPGSADTYDDRFTPRAYPTTGWNPSRPPVEVKGNRDKDRVFDDCYGYNNLGFRYTNVPNNHDPAVPNGVPIDSFQDRPPGRSVSLYYHASDSSRGGAGRNYAIQGSYEQTDDYSYIGATADIVDPAGTILLMDYCKADASPESLRYTTDVDRLFGYRFRHGGRANILFVDGHIEGCSKRNFLTSFGGAPMHWEVKRHP
ncbi:MAG: prepilin-type N-terminal cleavage/methylation domain-containing protein [Planctomycetota bacterium]